MNQRKKFQKKVEDFTCGNCGFKVKGTGFTNHCPKCLYSKHVDINPGDRKEACQGLMKPVSLESKGDKEIILHKCIKCGLEKCNKVHPEDNRKQVQNININNYLN